MFGALNRFMSRLDGEPVQQPRGGPNDNAFGFQILRNKDAEIPLEPWFDFIVGINGHTIVSLQIQRNQVNSIADTLRRKIRTPTCLRQRSAIAPVRA